MSFLARLSLANRGLVAIIAIVVLGFGAIAIPSLKQQLIPSIEFPAAFVVASYPGVSPDIVEEQVTKPIESALQGVPGLSDITSTSREGVATVQVSFEFGTSVDDITNKMNTAIARVRAQLPADVDPQVIAGSTDDLPAVVLAASRSGDQIAFAQQLDQVVVPALQGIEGVRQVEVTGAAKQNVLITLDPAKAFPAGVNGQSLTAALKSNGISFPAGTLTEGDKSLAVQVGGTLNTLDQLKNLNVTPTAKLGDVATVELKTVEATSITRTNGKASLGIAVTAAPDGNAVKISHAVRDKLADLEKSLGGDTKLTSVFDQAPFVESSIKSLSTEGALGLLFAVLVILVFLFSLRSTIVTAVSIPLSVVVALIGLWVGDYSLNLLTLGALTIAIGRVVDDSIVVLENIKRHLEYGEEKIHAILTGVKEVTGAVVASTLTTVAVFLPIGLVGGLAGELFRPFAVTIAVALLASLLVALTVVPVLAYWFLGRRRTALSEAEREEIEAKAHEKERRNLLQRTYVPIISWVTRSRTTRWITVAASIVVFIFTMGLASQLKTNFIDQSGQTEFSISQELPVGSSLATTDAAAKKIEDLLAKRSDIEAYQATIGASAGFGFGGAQSGNTANFSVTAVDGTDVEKVIDELRSEVTAAGDSVGTVKITAGGGGGGSGDQLEVVIKANNPDDLAKAADQVTAAMKEVSGVADVESNLAASNPRIDVKVKRDQAAKYGLSDAAVGGIVSAAYRGQTLTQMTIDGSQRDLVLRSGPAPTSLDQLKALTIPVQGNPPFVRLDQIADVTQDTGPVAITRIDGNRSASVTGRADSDNLGAVSTALQKKLDSLTFPAGATVTLGGATQDQNEAFGQLGLAMLAAIAIVFIIMVATFKSVAQPLILLVSIPFAATGAIILLLATGTPLGLPAMIGVLMLIGIVVTNAIVLMDLINQYQEGGMHVREAVVEGGRRRLRPILMTAVATICALLPMAIGLTGEGGFISQPLAIVVIGGLVSSTLLTLVLVPTLYTMVESTKEKRRQRREGKHASPLTAPDPGSDGPEPDGRHRVDPLEPAPSPL
ncbi:efflux RND transporter permease subunit [Dactylosporangium matsuzakiense]|uniref:Hydrogenase expression protein n=1 Tax=Dactylosporangium matsuzakiense TaxID=53360 RepID=A0A9W6KLC4_9ACTN|nr:efflux RND transporter permease subunit [Dactylosporangium matsuzakiense]UWZ43534.1 efflux RND transporter permease subunit [Dactylosporangium matsuzakiense]GLL04141.1 hydrogenase expression protein [Dactylosporangium matsuzakiense]